MMTRTGQHRRYCFTINNYTAEDEARLQSLVNLTNYLVYGREVGESGTPHLQGFVIFSSPVRFTRAKQCLGQTAHIEAARGTSQQCADYCKKDGNVEEFGQLPSNEGKRSDWVAYVDWVKDLGRVPTRREIIAHNPGLYARYSKKCFDIASGVLPTPVLTTGEPRFGWQTRVAGLIQGDDVSSRGIYFVVDPEGNSGKSWMCQWALTKFPEKVQVLRIGKRDDLAYSVDETRSVFLFDVPRGQMTYLQYSVLESLKDRMIFSAKYESALKILMQDVQVIVFCNEAPDMTQLTEDRYKIINV